MREIKSKSLLKKERDPKRKAWTIMFTANSGKKNNQIAVVIKNSQISGDL